MSDLSDRIERAAAFLRALTPPESDEPRIGFLANVRAAPTRVGPVADVAYLEIKRDWLDCGVCVGEPER